jgi:hypothetical protein
MNPVSQCHGLPVDDAGLQAQLGYSLNNERETPRQIIARPAVEPHPHANFAGDNPESVVLDLVQPERAGRRARGGRG